MGLLAKLVAVGFTCTQIILTTSTSPPTFHELTARLYAGDEAMTEHLIFGVSLATFMEHWHAQDPPDLYWKSDACTAAADNPLGYKFKDACRRHDFCYANLYRQGRFTDHSRKMCDNNFSQDLADECSHHKSEGFCHIVAGAYYGTVRVMGGKYIGTHNDVKKNWDKYESERPSTTTVCKEVGYDHRRKRWIECREEKIDYYHSIRHCQGNRGITCDQMVPDKHYRFEDCDENGRGCYVTIEHPPPQVN